MTRIIAGQARGRLLKVPTAGTRPTSDRVRESLFSSLDHQLGSWSGRRVLDLYAGTGALGLEALSRGAGSALAVDSSPGAVEIIRRNAKSVGLPLIVERADVSRWVANATQAIRDGQAVPARESDKTVSRDARGPFDVVFIDPPYELGLLQTESVVAQLGIGELIRDGAVVVVEYPTRAGTFAWPDGFTEVTDRRFGDTSVTRAVWYVAGNRN